MVLFVRKMNNIKKMKRKNILITLEKKKHKISTKKTNIIVKLWALHYPNDQNIQTTKNYFG